MTIDRGEDPDAEFFATTTVLKHIQDYAWSRFTSRLAVLGCELRRAIALVPPTVKLPPLTGRAASLNFFTATSGSSGRGKDAADEVAFDAIKFVRKINLTDTEDMFEPYMPGIGTGEGLARIFKGRKDQPPVIEAHLVVNEVKKLEALVNRQGATLESELLAAYMGQRLGAQNNSEDTTTAIDPHSYRLCLGVGVQPENAGFFLSKEKNGFPQRFLWLPAHDYWVPSPPPNGMPEQLDTMEIAIPTFSREQREEHIITVPEAIKRDIIQQRHRAVTCAPGVDPLDSHLMLTQEKTAVGLAMLHGEIHITDKFWDLAGHLMTRSRQTRDEIRTAVAEAARQINRARALTTAECDEVVVDRKLARCKEAILRLLSKKAAEDHVSRSDLRRDIRIDVRPYFDTAISELIEEGRISEIKLEDGIGFALVHPVHPVHPRPNSDDARTPRGVQTYTPNGREHGDQRKHANPVHPLRAATDATPGMTDRVKKALANAHHQLETEGER